MQERRKVQRKRSFRIGKILLNDHRSVIDCVIRNISAAGANLHVPSLAGIPAKFELQIDGSSKTYSCVAIWHAQNRLGVAFWDRDEDADTAPTAASDLDQAEQKAASDGLRGETLALRAALNEVPVGIVMLDRELRAQYTNRAFRRMWQLPDNKADGKPAFVSLMQHSRDRRAYEIPDSELNAYIAKRVTLVKAGDATPMDIRLANGEVLRYQCTALPNGGRMLSYTDVTDIVRHADELESLRAALDNVEEGILLLDRDFTVKFMNRAARIIWKIGDEIAERKPNYADLVGTARVTGAVAVAAEELEHFIAERIAAVRRGDPAPAHLALADGRIIRSRCTVLPNGGRMLTYSDVTDLVESAAEARHVATTDGATELFNRSHFLTLAEAEWKRFQRYNRPLSLLIFDLDHFKFINERLGGDAGDRAIAHLAEVARINKRPSDILARIGGDEFALLLPETDIQRAAAVGERLREKVAQAPLEESGARMKITISVGVAEATLSMSSIAALMKAADEALYNAKLLGRNRVSFAAPVPAPTHGMAAE